MPIKKENRALYPKDWKAISVAAKERAGWVCAHPGCTCRQYEVGQWDGDEWKPARDLLPDTTYAQARQDAADVQYSRYGDDPAAPKVIVIVLTTAHLDHNPENCAPENLAPMCQRHHLAYDHEQHQANAYMTRKARANTMELPLEADGVASGSTVADIPDETMASIVAFNAHGSTLMRALADIVGQHSRTFKQAPEQDFINREETMHNVTRIRDAYGEMVKIARPAILGSAGNAGVSASVPADETKKDADER